MTEDLTVPIRVLHTLYTYLETTQNWIYPQIACVPQTETAVLCRRLNNSSEFPRVGRPFFIQEPPREGPGLVARARRVALSRSRTGRVIATARAKRWRPAIVHAHFGTHGWETLALRRRLRVPLITSFYGFEAWSFPVSQPSWRDRFVQLFREGDLFLVEGPAMCSRMIEIGCPIEKLRIRRLGVDSANIPFAQPDFCESLKIAMVGRFVEKKGLVDGLRACILAARAGVHFKVTIIGDVDPHHANSEAIKQELLALSQSTELLNRVHFTGFLPHAETCKLLRRHNVLLCPSKHSSNGDAEGGMPFILAEALAMGLIGVGSRHCDMPELIIDGRTGYLFDEGNFEQLADLLKKISRTTNCLPSTAAAARKHIEENFNLIRQLTALGEIYREIASSKRREYS
jgi:colanic acid/amylovoran biosynthesis glycosyltransferase